MRYNHSTAIDCTCWKVDSDARIEPPVGEVTHDQPGQIFFAHKSTGQNAAVVGCVRRRILGTTAVTVGLGRQWCAPIQTEYLRSGGATTLIFMEDGASSVISLDMRSAMPGNMDVPPDSTMLPYRSLRMSTSHLVDKGQP